MDDFITSEKARLRSHAHSLRAEQTNKNELSRQIIAKCPTLPDWHRARTVLFYVDVRDEVRTRSTLAELLSCGKTIAVPFCVDDHLELFRLEEMGELTAGRFGVLEPKLELRSSSDRQVPAAEVDFVLVPGVAFDRCGARLGHGAGFYDRLLSTIRPDAVTVGIAFECQILTDIPTEAHDIHVDYVVTESAVYEGIGR